MRDPRASCSYNSLYQNVKRYSKNGEYFFKELMAVFQQRAELELNYAKGIQKLAGKLTRASKGMSNNSTYSAWCHVSDEMYSTADTHRTLGNAFQQEAVLQLRQVLDEHNKRKRPLDNHVEKTGKLLTANWNEQLKMKKKLLGITREHEALFNFVETNKHICTEKEKQKMSSRECAGGKIDREAQMLNRLTKSAETKTKLDEEYFSRNMEGHQIRLKWENTLKNCYQIIQELEKQRLEMLSTTLDRYHLHTSSFGQSLIRGQRGVEQAMQRLDLQKDIQALVEETAAPAQENKADFLMADYFEEDSKSLMGKERRRDAIKVKLQRLEHSIAKTKKDCEGLQRLMKSYADDPSFSNQKNLEEIQQLLEETTLKQDLLEATHYKVSMSVGALEGKPRAAHRFQHSISRWKDKDCEHSVVQLTRPVVMRRSSRNRRSLRTSSKETVKEQGAEPDPHPDQGPPKPHPDHDQGPPEPHPDQGPPKPHPDHDQGPPKPHPDQGPPKPHSDPDQGPPWPHHDPDQGPPKPHPDQGPPKPPPDPDQGPPKPHPDQGPPKPHPDPSAVRSSDPERECAEVDAQKAAEWSSIGTCKALYDFSPDQQDELRLRAGDVVELYWKEASGWWCGGRRGLFPSTYVEELPS